MYVHIEDGRMVENYGMPNKKIMFQTFLAKSVRVPKIVTSFGGPMKRPQIHGVQQA